MSTPRDVLLVDDDPHDVALTLRALRSYKLSNQVIVVSDGDEALDYLNCTGAFAGRQGGDPGLVLLDRKMPRMDGLEVLRVLRSGDRFKRLPVVMLTSSKEDNDIIESYNIGVNAYVVKPVDFHQFIDAVKTIGHFWVVLNEPPVA